MNELTTINSATATAMAADMKVALLATVNGDSLPHITLITTVQARDPYTIKSSTIAFTAATCGPAWVAYSSPV